MIIKGKPIRDFSLKVNTLFRGLICLLLLLFLVNLQTLTDSLAASAHALKKLSLVPQQAVAVESPPKPVRGPAGGPEPLGEPAPEAGALAPEVGSMTPEIAALRQAALARFASKFNFPNSVEFFSVASQEDWLFSPATVKAQDNVLNLTTCGYYTAKNALGLARERVPFMVELVYDFMQKTYSLSGYFKDDRAHYYQFEGRKKPLELNRNRFQSKWKVACAPVVMGAFDDILTQASAVRYAPDATVDRKRQVNYFDRRVQAEIDQCVEDATLAEQIPASSERQSLCLLRAQCHYLAEMSDSQCEPVSKTCRDHQNASLCQTATALTDETPHRS
ncbi:hypothetical protein [Photobacterium sp. TY1-4]|uniref:hypothetical protein n=1 Tax=Photobacterium sp. TY1-4 TaxID=2899122 RepID=UPI0021C1BABA|nr:hypothetical protein [Photobacterium sp. TY1-4]UXI01969.1 hypothetical protein NH461_04045 [Photobacterium sp. TY1-4]